MSVETKAETGLESIINTTIAALEAQQYTPQNIQKYGQLANLRDQAKILLAALVADASSNEEKIALKNFLKKQKLVEAIIAFAKNHAVNGDFEEVSSLGVGSVSLDKPSTDYLAILATLSKALRTMEVDEAKGKALETAIQEVLSRRRRKSKTPIKGAIAGVLLGIYMMFMLVSLISVAGHLLLGTGLATLIVIGPLVGGVLLGALVGKLWGDSGADPDSLNKVFAEMQKEAISLVAENANLEDIIYTLKQDTHYQPYQVEKREEYLTALAKMVDTLDKRVQEEKLTQDQKLEVSKVIVAFVKAHAAGKYLEEAPENANLHAILIRLSEILGEIDYKELSDKLNFAIQAAAKIQEGRGAVRTTLPVTGGWTFFLVFLIVLLVLPELFPVAVLILSVPLAVAAAFVGAILYFGIAKLIDKHHFLPRLDEALKSVPEPTAPPEIEKNSPMPASSSSSSTYPSVYPSLISNPEEVKEDTLKTTLPPLLEPMKKAQFNQHSAFLKEVSKTLGIKQEQAVVQEDKDKRELPPPPYTDG